MKKWDKKEFHLEHHSRNLGLLTEEEQKKIDGKILLIAGCGVGSLIAISAARLGFEKLLLVDGDYVELSNINRQGYSSKDVGKFKVDALAKRIEQINPHAKIRKYPVFIDPKNAADFVQRADIIIDAIDPDAGKAIIAMHRAAKKEKKTVIQPSDIGWGAMLQIFTPSSVSYEEMIGLDPKVPISEINENQAFQKFINYYIKIMPEYVKKIAMEVSQGSRKHYPQPVSAAYILSAMTVMAAKRIANKQPVVTAPNYVSFDPDDILKPKK